MTDPTLPDGTCPICIRSYADCTFHRGEDRARAERWSETLRLVKQSNHHRKLEGISLRHELESDEGGTRWEKAERILSRTA